MKKMGHTLHVKGGCNPCKLTCGASRGDVPIATFEEVLLYSYSQGEFEKFALRTDSFLSQKAVNSGSETV